MKKIISVLIFICISCAFTADDDYTLNAKTFSWGIKAGINLAKLTGDHMDNMDYKTGAVFGIFINRPISSGVDLKIGADFSMKGGLQEEEESESDEYGYEKYSVTAEYVINYIEMPLTFNFYLPLEGTFKPYILAGCTAGINTKAEAKYNIDYEYYYNDGYDIIDEEFHESEVEEIPDVNSADFGFVLGAGTGISVRDGVIILELKYNRGLTSFINSEDVDIFNDVISFTFGYGFR